MAPLLTRPLANLYLSKGDNPLTQINLALAYAIACAIGMPMVYRRYILIAYGIAI